MAVATAKPPAAHANGQAPPRKRRKRTTAPGAADDCFTCHKLGATCDRKRPYCSPCLQAGHECAGYKTTLTWGIGVASRGKLRGLSLPVAGTANVPDIAQPSTRRRHSSISSVVSNSESNSVGASTASAGSSCRPSVAFGPPLATVQETRPIDITTHQAQGASLKVDTSPLPPAWYAQGRSQPQSHRQSVSASPLHGTTPFHIPFASPHGEFGFPASFHAMALPSDGASAHNFPPTPGSYTFSDSASGYGFSSVSSLPPPSYHSHVMETAMAYDNPPASPRSLMSPHQPSTSMSNSFHDIANSGALSTMADLGSHDALQASVPLSEDPFQQFDMTFDELMIGHEQLPQHEDDDHVSSPMTRPVYNNPFFHLSPRMRQLFDYYDKHICSALVAFDGDSNPYRTHIFGLAAHNEGLQNAIAALATNNLRMRRQTDIEGADLVNRIETYGSTVLSDYISSSSQPSEEEACYKALSVEQLNMQLVQPSGADDDAVLATLLILCLFHVCDSGFSKFKTQLVGVQKLLSLRSQAGTHSPFVSWVQMFFTWVDVITSSVNDRETEIEADAIDDFEAQPQSGTLEQISGCDTRLFKLIGRLGRLNVLSQGRPVRPRINSQSPAMLRRPMNLAQWRRHTYNAKSRTPDPSSSLHLDGNGWAMPLDDLGLDHPQTRPQTSHPDGRTAFWTEWHDTRAKLQTWSMDYSRIPGAAPPATRSSTPLGTPPPSSPASTSHHPLHSSTPAPTSSASTSLTSPIQRDLVHINESFRAAALLYTERLSRPAAPSSDRAFQSLVAQALFHVTALSENSCVAKFLLWPLFIIGTEAVEVDHRRAVRERCVALQRESGFINNLCVLEVLERTWRDGCATRGGLVGIDGEQGLGEGEERSRGAGLSWGPCGLEGDFEGIGKGAEATRQAFKWRRAMDRVDGEYIVV